MPVSNDKFYKPEEALHELQVQETILKDLGYNFEFIQIIGGDSLNFKEVFTIHIVL